MPEPRPRRAAHAVEVLSTERLSDSLVRVVVGGPGLADFEPSPCTDSYVKVVFVHPAVPRPLPRTPRTIRNTCFTGPSPRCDLQANTLKMILL